MNKCLVYLDKEDPDYVDLPLDSFLIYRSIFQHLDITGLSHYRLAEMYYFCR